MIGGVVKHIATHAQPEHLPKHERASEPVPALLPPQRLALPLVPQTLLLNKLVLPRLVGLPLHNIQLSEIESGVRC